MKPIDPVFAPKDVCRDLWKRKDLELNSRSWSVFQGFGAQEIPTLDFEAFVKVKRFLPPAMAQKHLAT